MPPPEEDIVDPPAEEGAEEPTVEEPEAEEPTTEATEGSSDGDALTDEEVVDEETADAPDTAEEPEVDNGAFVSSMSMVATLLSVGVAAVLA